MSVWGRLRAAPVWLWAVVAGLAWFAVRLWTQQATARRLAAIDKAQAETDETYQDRLATAGASSDAERAVILDEARRAGDAIGLERVAVRDSAAKGQAAFAEHWSRVMGRRK